MEASSLPLSEFPNLSLDPARLPRHVAIVMDGNGRWAVKRGLNRCEGHRRGKDSVRAVVETARQLEELRRLGCDYAQGYWFSEPIAAAEFERFIRQ